WQQLSFPQHHTSHYRSPSQTLSSSSPSQSPAPAITSPLLPRQSRLPFPLHPAVHMSLFLLVPAVALPPIPGRLCLPQNLTPLASQAENGNAMCRI
ncbi:hypothetical protein Prudu_522S000100, partial [Prunus dulcis]